MATSSAALEQNLCNLEPSGYGINHCQAMKCTGILFLRIPDVVGTYQVNTQSFPRDLLASLWWHQSQLTRLGFVHLAALATLTYLPELSFA